ncbi:MAG: hypothetical protein HYR89_01040 [Actinobacteria bacterium]|nr:hypothetical protein [Actinomycetota bacterium]
MSDPDRVADPAGHRAGSSGVLRAPALALLVALAAAVTAQGAFYPADQRLIALPLLVSVVLTVAKIRATVMPWSLLVSGGLLAAWALLLGEDTGDGAGIALLVAGVVAVVMVVASMGQAERVALTGAVVALGVAVACSGWWGVAFHSTELALPGQGLWRASTTLTYANAAAGLLGPLALFALARLTTMVSRERQVWLLALVVVVVGLGATLSRAGLIAWGCGVVVILRRQGFQPVFSAMVPVLLGAGVALIGLGPSFAEGGVARPIPAAMGLVAGMAATLTVASWSPGRLAAVVVAAGLFAGVAVVGGMGGDTLGRLGDTRLSFSSTDRSEMFHAGIDSISKDPWTGAGPGQGRLRYHQGNGKFVEARFVHNEYLQIGVELGVVGVVLLLAMIGTLAWGAKKGSRLLPGNIACGVGAALVALGVQAGFDFLWHIPAIPLVGAVFAGVAWPRGSGT